MVFYYTRNFLKVSELNFVSISQVSPIDQDKLTGRPLEKVVATST